MDDFEMKEHRYDVVCIGGGGGGITAAVTAARGGARVALISKEPIGYGNTRLSGGGVATDDVPQDFFEDVMISGQGLSRPQLARTVAEGAASAIAQLQEYGNVFRTTVSGTPEVRFRGGHRKARSAMCAYRGRSMGQSLRGIAAKEDINVFEEMIVARLLTAERSVCGLVALDLISGQFHWFHTPAIVLATGGAGWLYYPHTDCVKSAVGDGFALALEAGAELMDMEQVQFLPFAVTHPQAYQGIYCGEPSNLAGPEGRVLNARGDLILDHMDKRTRGEVSNAMWREIVHGQPTEHGGLLLDISGNPEKDGRAIQEKVGSIFEIVRYAYGERAYSGQEPLDVAPTAHHSLGGVRADERGRTQVKGLYAIGEVQGGVHGGNRLAGVALVELFVLGKAAGQDAVDRNGSLPTAEVREGVAALLADISQAMARQEGPRPIALKEQVFEIMWHSVSGIRSEDRLQRGLSRLEAVRQSFPKCQVAPLKRYNTELLDYLELRLMLITAKAMLVSALERRESRGTHLREDYPEPDEEHGARNMVLEMKEGKLAHRWASD
jgi:succinate dehydrogenase/fumarate reductase flavoprotein subunit